MYPFFVHIYIRMLKISEEYTTARVTTAVREYTNSRIHQLIAQWKAQQKHLTDDQIRAEQEHISTDVRKALEVNLAEINEKTKQFVTEMRAAHRDRFAAASEDAGLETLTPLHVTGPGRAAVIAHWESTQYHVRLSEQTHSLAMNYFRSDKPQLFDIFNECIAPDVVKTSTGGGTGSMEHGRSSLSVEVTESETHRALSMEPHRASPAIPWKAAPIDQILCRKKRAEQAAEDEPKKKKGAKESETPRFARPHTPFADLLDPVQSRMMEMLDCREHLGRDALPSIAQYTMFNAGGQASMEISRFGDLVASGGKDGPITIWDISREESGPDDNRWALVGHCGPVTSVSISPDNALLLSAGVDGSSRLWFVGGEGRGQLSRIDGHMTPLWSIKWSPFGSYYVTASHSGLACLWSCERPSPVRVFKGHLHDVHHAHVHPSGDMTVTAGSDRKCRLFDHRAPGSAVHVLSRHPEPAVTAATSPDGRLLASADSAGLIMVWDLRTGRLIATLSSHTSSVRSLSWDTSGALMSSVGADGVRLWDMVHLRQTAQIPPTEHFPMEYRELEEPGPIEVPFSTNSVPDLHLSIYPTKGVPLVTGTFTHSNVLLVGGAYDAK